MSNLGDYTLTHPATCHQPRMHLPSYCLVTCHLTPPLIMLVQLKPLQGSLMKDARIISYLTQIVLKVSKSRVFVDNRESTSIDTS
jgi:hypothetical protein